MHIDEFKNIVDNFKTEGLSDYGVLFLEGLKKQLENAIEHNKEYVMYYPPNKPVYELSQSEKDVKTMKLATIDLLLKRVDSRHRELIESISTNKMSDLQIIRYEQKEKMIKLVMDGHTGIYRDILEKEAKDKGTDLDTYLDYITKLISRWKDGYTKIACLMEYFRIKAKAILLTDDDEPALRAIDRLEEITIDTTLEEIDNMFI